MDNENITEQTEEELPAAQEGSSAQDAGYIPVISAEELAKLEEELLDTRIKLCLMISGAAYERLEDAAKIARGLYETAGSPGEAARLAVSEYPHLRLAKRSVPQFSAQSGGSSDGFAAIRGIFAKR